MKEIFKDIPNYEGLYQVSNKGRVSSLPKEWITGRGRLNFHNGIILKNGEDKDGYYHVNLYKNKKRKKYSVHRLVAQAFILNPYNKPQINHKDLNKQNNYIWNLEWCSGSYNQRHRYRNKNDGWFAPVNQYDLSGKFIKRFHSIISATKAINLKSKSAICNCCANRTKTSGGFIWRYAKK